MARLPSGTPSKPVLLRGFSVLFGAAVCLGMGLLLLFEAFVIDVPTGHMALLIKKTGLDLPNDDFVAPDARHKGVQKNFLSEGRYYFAYNPYDWEWEVVPQLVISDSQRGVKIRLYGDDLPYGEFLATKEGQKGIVPGTLPPGRYPINKYLETVELHPLVVVPAGFKGVQTNLAGQIPTEANDYAALPNAEHTRRLLVKPGFRGVQNTTLDPGTYALNPYETRVSLVDCRNQRFNLADSSDLGFPSKDGFWVSLDSIVEFRVNPEMAAQVFVLYNEEANGEQIDEELVRKVILPAARSFCRLQGSNNLGREFIQGSSRTQFQDSYQTTMRAACDPLGIQIINALITKINPPEQIAEPVRSREIAKQKEKQYQQQILQQKSEENLAMDKALVLQKRALVQAQQEVVKVTTEAAQKQEVTVTKANERLAVAKLKLEATVDESAAITSRGKAAAEVVQMKNAAEAAGWKRAVTAFNGDGQQYAQYVLYTKMAGAYRNIMVNTADSPIMKVFENFNKQPATVTPGPAQPGTKLTGSAPAESIRTTEK